LLCVTSRRPAAPAAIVTAARQAAEAAMAYREREK